MRRRTRQVLIALSAAVAVGSLAALVVLGAGRPLYYTDGGALVRADTLAESPMVVWDRPLPEVELPGPVRGRVAQIPDGRLIYGRVDGATRTRLVVFDPRTPALEPVPLVGVGSPGHDLAPALDRDGNLLFASDRDGGEGGFDLWLAPSLSPGRFGPPVSLPPSINTVADELDPAPHPSGAELAFARRSADGRGARLWIGRVAGQEPARPVFVEEADPRRRLLPRIDREPAFAVDGVALWFVRERAGQAKEVCVSVRHAGSFAEPVRDAALSGRGAFRAPWPATDAIFVLRDAAVPLWCRAPLRLVHPWWAGQHGLERALWTALLAALTVLGLLLLGARWRALDIVTWCILASLVLHLLFWLLIEGVPLATREVELPPSAERTALRVVAASAAGGRAMDGARGDLAARAQRPARDRSLDARAPGSELPADAQPAIPRPALTSRPAVATDPERSTPAAVLNDAPAPSVRGSSARDTVSTAVAALAVAMPGPATADIPARDDAGPAVAGAGVDAPGSHIAGGGGQVAAVAGARPAVSFEPASVSSPVAILTDAPLAAGALAAAEGPLDSLAARAAPSTSVVGRAARAQPPRAQRAEGTGLDAPGTPVPGSALVRPGTGVRAAVAVDAPRPAEMPADGRGPSPDVALRDTVVAARPAPLAEDGGRRAGEAATRRLPASVPSAAPGSPGAPARVGVADAIGAGRPSSVLPGAPRRVRTVAAVARAEPVGLYGNRFGPRKARALERFGGSAETEAAVAQGLRYLASVQDRRGHWGRRARQDGKYGETWVGKTGLCLLAFLGAGHVPGRPSEHADVAERALDALLKAQHRDTGHFGVTTAYSHGIATYAVAECYAITRDDRLRGPLDRALAWIVQNQDRGRDPRSRGGWGYYSPFLRAEDGYARMSVTAWQLMALESAKLSGVAVPDATIEAAHGFLRRMFDARRGYFLYSQDPTRLRSSWRTLPASTPAATFCLLLLGDDRGDARVEAGIRYTRDRAPKAWRRASEDRFVLRAEGNPYFWYYGTLACFLSGGDAWQRWNEALKATLLPAQNDDGSFTPIGAYARYADDRRGDFSYTTALAVLCLEAYYRYFTPLLEGR